MFKSFPSINNHPIFLLQLYIVLKRQDKPLSFIIETKKLINNNIIHDRLRNSNFGKYVNTSLNMIAPLSPNPVSAL